MGQIQFTCFTCIITFSLFSIQHTLDSICIWSIILGFWTYFSKQKMALNFRSLNYTVGLKKYEFILQVSWKKIWVRRAATKGAKEGLCFLGWSGKASMRWWHESRTEGSEPCGNLEKSECNYDILVALYTKFVYGGGGGGGSFSLACIISNQKPLGGCPTDGPLGGMPNPPGDWA